jgi:predicted enzyme related to lactoylglutathione lyase
MINGIHALIYNKEAEKLRAFFSDVLGFRAVDAGQGWLIFALPPAELGIHPTDGKGSHELYLMCDDLQTTIKELESKGVKLAEPVKDAGWGLLTAIEVPGGEVLHLVPTEAPNSVGAGAVKAALWSSSQAPAQLT